MTPTTYSILDDWIAREVIPFSPDSPQSVNTAVDRLVAALGNSVELLGFGEALHAGGAAMILGAGEILTLRNRLFERLVVAHGYSAIAVESSFPRGRLVNEYLAGRGPRSFDDVRETGFSHGFGRLDANRDLVERMHHYNADADNPVEVRFYGFDSPTEMTGSDSPRQLLEFVLDYLTAIDDRVADDRRQRIGALLGNDADWENPAAVMDPTRSIGLSPSATALRTETEDLISELLARRPELIAKTDADRYSEAVQHASAARWMLTYHAATARSSPNRTAELLGLRDAMMADNLAYMVNRERGRGKVFAFAHNSHLTRGRAEWQWGPNALSWWPAGAHMNATLGPRYAVIATAVGTSEANGLAAPEAGTLESRLSAVPSPALFLPTHRGRGLPAAELAALPTRPGSTKNPTYLGGLSPRSIADFDAVAFLRAMV